MIRRLSAALLWPPATAISVGLLLVFPLLVVGEASDNEARARARAEMFAGGASVAELGVRTIERYLELLRRDLIAAAAGDLRRAISSRAPEDLLLAADRAASTALGNTKAPAATRASITNSAGSMLIELTSLDLTFCLRRGITCPGGNSLRDLQSAPAASTLVEAARGRSDPKAVELLAASNSVSRSRLSEPFITDVNRQLTTVIAIGTLITPDDGTLTPLGMVVVDVSVDLSLSHELAVLVDRAEDLYVIDRAGSYLWSARPTGVEPHADLMGSPLVAKAVRSQPIVASLTGPVTLHEDGRDPFGAGTRPFVTAIMTMEQGLRTANSDAYGWQVLVVPDQSPVRNVELTLGQLRLARFGLGAVLVLGAFLLATVLRAISKQRAKLALANDQLTATGLKLEEVNAQLSAATRHKSEFLANMSHELRTPLNAIIGFADVLEQKLFGDLNAKQAEYVDDISGSGRHLLDLVNEILDLSKVEAGRMELERHEFAIAETIRATLTFVRERAASHAIHLSADLPADLGSANADERKIRQVMLNLLSNAVKFTPAGGSVHLTARRERDELVVAVRDTGIGIAPEDQAKVFEEFRQVGKPSDRSREGTGLGLTLAKRFVELHGGRIWLKSAPGSGTTITFAIPTGQTAAVPALA